MEKYDLIIIGAGPGGMTAALYAARYNLKTLIISKTMGGMAATAHFIENFPTHKSINGYKMMELFKEQLELYNVPMVFEAAEKIDKDGEDFKVKTHSGKEFIGRYIVLAMGTDKRRLELPNEGRFNGKGVHYCASCDGFFYKNKVVGVVGGNDGATTTALMLSGIASKVYIIYRREALRGEPIWVSRINKDPKIEVVLKSNVKELKGEKFLTSVILDTRREIALDGLFIEIGADPKSEIAKELGVKADEAGYIFADKSQKTNVDKVFAVGDITTNELKQIITSSAEGAIAVYEINKDMKRRNS